MRWSYSSCGSSGVAELLCSGRGVELMSDRTLALKESCIAWKSATKGALLAPAFAPAALCLSPPRFKRTSSSLVRSPTHGNSRSSVTFLNATPKLCPFLKKLIVRSALLSRTPMTSPVP
eukprot:CAMPEP_0202373744 /NCGR_PEP_ID=MMETSP1127-20130417/4707_1 /ASSEMBLY_ACC=CAM_ASM_000462 /TAXON_ID=3047 /ORGANISM="Dunaliella tertiolecta, Strain CCMP1320" /LENGTH=118 /DNA_ID=CAMNT_0048970713 /DNA_START=497 /DNA_END=853 /DNA_ORIENTATION=-